MPINSLSMMISLGLEDLDSIVQSHQATSSTLGKIFFRAIFLSHLELFTPLMDIKKQLCLCVCVCVSAYSCFQSWLIGAAVSCAAVYILSCFIARRSSAVSRSGIACRCLLNDRFCAQPPDASSFGNTRIDFHQLTVLIVSGHVGCLLTFSDTLTEYI